MRTAMSAAILVRSMQQLRVVRRAWRLGARDRSALPSCSSPPVSCVVRVVATSTQSPLTSLNHLALDLLTALEALSR